jgi:hypothetical protein
VTCHEVVLASFVTCHEVVLTSLGSRKTCQNYFMACH